MLPLSITFVILAVACLVFSVVDNPMDIGKVVAWWMGAGVSGTVACVLFLVWAAQRLFQGN